MGRFLHRVRALFLLAIVLNAVSFPVFAQNDFRDPGDVGAGFLTLDVGYFRLLGNARKTFSDPIVGYLNVGWAFLKEAGLEEDFSQFQGGFKFGFGGGGPRSPKEVNLFYDLLLKFRYTFQPTSWFHPFLTFGPGYLTYEESRFQIESGLGFDLRFGKGILGFSSDWKEIFGHSSFRRGLTFLGRIGYAWD